MAIGEGHHGIGQQAMTVAAQRVVHVAQLTGGIAFAVESGIRIGTGLMSVVPARVTLEVAVAAASLAAVVVGPAHEALVTRRRLDQRAIHTEVCRLRATASYRRCSTPR